MQLYPVHLQLQGRTVLLVGGGAVACARASALIHAGAHIRVVSPAISQSMRLLSREFRFPIAEREFCPGDLDQVWMVVGATDSPEAQQAVFVESRRKGILVCIVDDPARSDFIVPAVLRRGDLLVTVSTSGVAPALAARIRDQLGEVLGENYGRTLELLRAVRERFKKEIPDFCKRREAWYRLLDMQVIPALRQGKIPDLTYDRTRDES